MRVTFYLTTCALFTLLIVGKSQAKNVIIHWSREGELFGVAAVNKLVVSAGDVLVISCPGADESAQLAYEIMYENVWMVGSEGYANCDARNDGKLVALCSNPDQVTDIPLTDVVTSFGKTFHFISTSNGHLDSIKTSKRGGHCETQNLKLTVYVQ